MYPEDVQGRVPTTAIERRQLASEREMWREDNQPPAEHDADAIQRLKEWRDITVKRMEWLDKISNGLHKKGTWFSSYAYWMYDKIGETWVAFVFKPAEPTIMDVPDPYGDTCYITERIDPIEHKDEGTDPDAVGQAVVEFIRQIQLPVQNAQMPMEKVFYDRVHGGSNLLCRCKLSYGIAVREFIRFSPLGPWIPRRKETQLLGYPMSQ